MSAAHFVPSEYKEFLEGICQERISVGDEEAEAEKCYEARRILKQEQEAQYEYNDEYYEGVSGDFQCYELVDDYVEVLKLADFWLHGVAMFAIGTVGLIGNIITLYILPR